MILSFFHNASRLLTQLADSELLVLALTETAKLLPYVTSNRKSVKIYLKVHNHASCHFLLPIMFADMPRFVVII